MKYRAALLPDLSRRVGSATIVVTPKYNRKLDSAVYSNPVESRRADDVTPCPRFKRSSNNIICDVCATYLVPRFEAYRGSVRQIHIGEGCVEL